MDISLDGQVYLAEITACIDDIGTLQTFYFCGGSGTFCTSPLDTPQNTYYEPRLLQPADITRPMFSDVTTGGQSTVSWGLMDLSNIDGGLDFMMNYSFDNRPVRILVGDPQAPYSTFKQVLACTIQLAQFNYNAVHFTLRDLGASLDLQLITHLYGGTNVLPNGVDGVSDIQGNPVPRLYGAALNFQPICVNTSKLTFQIHDGPVTSIQKVYDQGLALTLGTNYATAALLNAATPAVSTYDTCLAQGYFRLGSTPVGPVTCDATNGAAVANRTPAQLIKQVVVDMGLGAAILASDVIALDAAATVDCGVWVSDSSSAFAVINKIACSCAAYVGFDGVGALRMAQLQAPVGTPSLSIDYAQIKDIDVVATNDAQNGIPVYGVNVTYAQNNTIQTTGLAGGVTLARKNVLALPALTASAMNAAVKTKYLSSQLMVKQTALLSAVDAQAEANRLLALYSVQRYAFQVTVKLDSTIVLGLVLNALVLVTLNRFAMDSGKLFRLIQIEANYAAGTAILTLWG